jgi:DNA-binding transcriptional LysR family regulator
MTALRLADDFRMLAVASPTYLNKHGTPTQPQHLHGHNCIRYRTPWDGVIQPWLFSKTRGKEIEITVEGSLIVNDIDLVLSAALDGIGIAYVPEPLATPYFAQGRW